MSLIDVYVKLPSGRTSVQNLQPTDLVEKIYKNVAGEEGVGIERVRIKYTGKVLKKSDTIGYKGICRETVLKGEIIFPKEMTVIIKDPSGESSMITVTNVDPILKLKREICGKLGHPTSQQSLLYGGRLLTPDTQSLMDAGVTPEAVINLKVTDPTATFGWSPSVKRKKPPEGITDAVLSSFNSAGRPVEVVFSFDTTGSMYSCLTEVRTKLRQACTRLLRDIPNIRIGVIAHGDYCDQRSQYVLRSVDLTRDVDSLCAFVNDVPSTGGGDTPECYEWVLRKAQTLDWSDEAAKALVVIGDCEPHPPGYTDQGINWHQELDVLVGMDVKVYGVQAQNQSGVKEFYEEMADRSAGCYINFKHFNLITDMFLAVCYKESSAEQLEAFCEEVREDGRMTEEKEAMFSQLENTTPQRKQSTGQGVRYVAAPWWDPQLDTSKRPQYKYTVQTDLWDTYTSPLSSVTLRGMCPSPVHSPHTRSKSHKKKKTGCEVM
ncbi:LOW QUALITY PROTEIN: uncharacterized protein LOC135478168 [Liolophura sinensis]|uniref:LOW QUALITY PROTEIN: uncharacterized protein LOC135478168 n=1 Tax=Liolophura sinensis TaxID=3198878 RepID=UPI0031586503